MKKTMKIALSALALGAVVAYVRYNILPEIKVLTIDYINRSIIVEVRGKTIILSAKSGGQIVTPKYIFSKYSLFFGPDKANNNDIYVLYFADGVGKERDGNPIYFNFKTKETY